MRSLADRVGSAELNRRSTHTAQLGFRIRDLASQAVLATAAGLEPAPGLGVVPDFELGQIAAGLNGRGIPTAPGGAWSAVQVRRVLERARCLHTNRSAG